MRSAPRRRQAPVPLRIPRFLSRRIIATVIACLTLAGGFFFCKGKVVQVSDGDTLTVLTGSGFTKVRLYGVDCPESRQKGGEDATTFARDLLLLSPVSLSVMDTDQYGRKVAVVRLEDGRLANEELVRAGHAWVYRSWCREPICTRWLALERQAKKQGLGFWRHKNPVPPWQWRRANPRR